MCRGLRCPLACTTCMYVWACACTCVAFPFPYLPPPGHSVDIRSKEPPRCHSRRRTSSKKCHREVARRDKEGNTLREGGECCGCEARQNHQVPPWGFSYLLNYTFLQPVHAPNRSNPACAPAALNKENVRGCLVPAGKRWK